MKRKILAFVLSMAMAAAVLGGCGTVGGNSSKQSEESKDAGDSGTEQADGGDTKEDGAGAEEKNADGGTDGKTYKIGICQQLEHQALDAATEGFKDALIEKLGEGNV